MNWTLSLRTKMGIRVYILPSVTQTWRWGLYQRGGLWFGRGGCKIVTPFSGERASDSLTSGREHLA